MRSDYLRLLDILDAIEVVAQYLPSSRELFDKNPPLQSHIYRHRMIVGEAAWRLSKEIKSNHPDVPWDQIEGMRHIMVHDYFRVDWNIVYNTAATHLPKFKPQVEKMLRSLPDKS